MSEPEPHSEPEASDPNAIGRRRLLEIAAGAAAACAGLGVLGVVGTAVVGTPLAGEVRAPGWYDLGPLEALPKDRFVKVSVEGERVDAWNRFPNRSLGRVLVQRRGEGLTVFSSVCPHNGCDVSVEEDGFLCPCHDSTFAGDGSLKSGKSPRGLDPLEHELREERLWVRFVRFEVGIPERKPV